MVNSILLKTYGAQSEYGPDIPLSAFVVIMKLFQIILNIACGITAGALPIMGYNYGAKLYNRVKDAFKLVAVSTTTVCAIATILFEALPPAFIRLFGADGELYTTFAVHCLRIYLSLMPFTCLQKARAMFLQSIGHAKAAVPLSILRDMLLIVFSLVIPMRMGVTGIFWAAPAADLTAMAITAVVIARVWKQLGNSVAREPESGKTVLQPSRPGVIITIAREHGTAGKQIGQLVAKNRVCPATIRR